MRNKILLIALIGLLVLTGPAFAPAESQAAEKTTTQTRGVYWFDPYFVGNDITDTYIYDDALLTGDPVDYDPQLATMSFELASASVSSERTPDYSIKSQNLRAYLEDNGFIDFDTNEDYKVKMRADTMGAACAHKKITDGGKEYTLLAIVPRSAGYEAEWNGNFTLGASGDHANYAACAEKVLAYAREYIQKYGISGDIKVWTSGYSRGAATANLLTKRIIDDPEGSLGSGVSLAMKDLYCYAFGTPRASDASQDPHASKYDLIHNLLEPYDAIAGLPPEQLGFDRYGKTYEFQTGAYKSESYERMMEIMKDMNPLMYDYYNDGGNPFEYTPMKVDAEALMNEGSFRFIPDDQSYLPDSQAEFLELVQDAVATAVGTRENYHENYDDSMAHFGSFVMTHQGQMGDLFGQIQKNKLAIPMVLSMYLSYNADRSRDVVIEGALYDQLKQVLDDLGEGIQKMKEQGIDTTQLEAMYQQIAELVQPGMKLDVIADQSWDLTARLYGAVMSDALKTTDLDQEIIDQMTGLKESRAISRLLAYILLYDKEQTEGLSFDYLNQQFCHLATIVSNGGKYMTAHYNEYILPWLKQADSNYDDVVKENAAQMAGYRRVYIQQPEGVDVTAVVKDSSGQAIAQVKNGELVSSTDPWVAVTSCDNGNWLRLPADDSYTIDLQVSQDTALSLRVSEYSTAEGREVREVTSDKNYKWQDLTINTKEKVALHVSEVKASKGNYKLASKADYYITKGKPVLVAKGIAKGKKAVKISWNGVPGADRYVVYMSKCNNETKKVAVKKVKTLKAAKTSWTKKGLARKSIYKFRVAAQQKQGGKYVTIAVSRNGHFATGNLRGSFTNPRSLKLGRTSLSMTSGQTVKIRGTLKKAKAGKRLISHEKRLRFFSDNTAVATVDAGGTVTAVGTGSCKVYVQAVNGLWKCMKINVK